MVDFFAQKYHDRVGSVAAQIVWQSLIVKTGAIREGFPNHSILLRYEFIREGREQTAATCITRKVVKKCVSEDATLFG